MANQRTNPDVNFYGPVTIGGSGGTFTFGDGTYSVNGNLHLSSGPAYFGNTMLSINGNLSVSSGASLCSIPAPCGGGTATMTIVNNGTVTFAGGSVSEIAAPQTGATYGIPGILIASNYASAPATYAMLFSGGTNGTYSGALYFPNASAEFSGGASTSGANCLQIIANVVYLTGGSTTAVTCPNFSSGIGTATAKMVQ